jgi:hypothetical protein
LDIPKWSCSAILVEVSPEKNHFQHFTSFHPQNPFEVRDNQHQSTQKNISLFSFSYHPQKTAATSSPQLPQELNELRKQLQDALESRSTAIVQQLGRVGAGWERHLSGYLHRIGFNRF